MSHLGTRHLLTLALAAASISLTMAATYVETMETRIILFAWGMLFALISSLSVLFTAIDKRIEQACVENAEMTASAVGEAVGGFLLNHATTDDRSSSRR